MELSDQEVLELIEFLKALDGEPLNAMIPKLPPVVETEKTKAETKTKTKAKTKAKAKTSKKKT